MLEKAYEAKKYEDKIYKIWENAGAFAADVNSNKKPFTISMPPPNATGVLHLGHAVMLAIEDILIRHRRMKGYEALWLPGTDHAAIATQNKVEKLIAEEGLTREKLGRESFLNRVKEYVADSQSTIRNQVRKMGSSCDWSRERYTFDDDLSKAVMETFVRMYEDELIYRGHRIVNWCPRCHSTLSDDEVEYDERVEKLYWIKYGPFTLATARPETKLGDTAVAVHPDDDRYKDKIGKKFMIPGALGEFEVMVVADKAVKMDFGSGVIKVTPAHSFVDFEIAQKNNVPVKKIINEEGKMMANCGKYKGMTTQECREEIVKDMKKMGLIEKIEDNYEHSVAICYRCNHVIEPLTSDQWFIDVNKKLNKFGGKTIKDKTNEVIKNGSIEIIPKRFEKAYFNWTENLQDWCISRQIWWGHRIPVWYCNDCDEIIVSCEEPTECTKCKSGNLKQDEDTLDTWFSSGLWTFSTLGWPEETDDLKKFHPTQVLETGYDILTFWILRMVIMTTYILDEIPFEKVYLHGLIRDKEGRKMSKSLGNGIDPIEMINKFGADALRMSMVIGNTPGNDMRLYEDKIKAYRNFTNKIWNASRFVLGIFEEKGITDEPKIDYDNLSNADEWILDKLNKTIKSVDENLMKFRISDAGQLLYDFLWNDFCDWYLELSKGDRQNLAVLYFVLKNILILLHPFMPFVTEEIWSNLPGQKELLIKEAYPQITDKKYSWQTIDQIIGIITSIRRMRSENKIEPAQKIPVIIYGHKSTKDIKKNESDIIRLARVSNLTIEGSGEKIKNAAADVVDGIEIFVPLEGLVDTKKEKTRLEKEVSNLENYIQGLSAKLNNDKFVKNAPTDIVEGEKEKLKDSEAKVEKLKEQLNRI